MNLKVNLTGIYREFEGEYNGNLKVIFKGISSENLGEFKVEYIGRIYREREVN